MPPAPLRRSAAFLATLGALPVHVAAQAGAAPGGPIGAPAATVAVTDPATDVVDQLLALVPVRGAVSGQRPYGTREVRRIAAAAQGELARPGRRATPADARAAALVRALLDAYGADGTPAPALTLRPVDFVWAYGVGAGERARQVPAFNGPGLIDARTLPALDARFGRPAVQGAVGSVETGHALGVGGWLAVVAQPRASLLVERRPGGGAVSRVNVEPQRLHARVVARNVALQAGVDEWALGQGGAAGAFLSANARPLRAVSVQADTAFALPGFLRGAGRWRALLAVADLGRDQNFPHAKLAFYKVSLAPSPQVELGAGVMSQFGGHGAPRLTLAQRAADLLPLIGSFQNGGDDQSSNKIATADARLRLPGWRGLTVGYEVDLDDFDVRRVGGVLRDDANHLVDVRVARLAGDGSLALALTARRTGIRMYRHAQFTSGVTYRGAVLGDPLGPNARAAGAALTWRPAPFDALALSAAYESRDASLYENVTTGPNQEGFSFRLVEARPVERRLRAALAWDRGLPGRGASTAARLGVERVGNYAFAAGATIARPFGEAGVRLRF